MVMVGNSSSQNVTVNASPTGSFTGLPATICVHAAAFTLTGNQAPNGTFTGAGITDNANGTASFSRATAGVGGPYTINLHFIQMSMVVQTVHHKPSLLLQLWLC